MDIGMDVCMDSHMTTKIFEIDGLPNFLRYGAPLACLWRAGAPLKTHLAPEDYFIQSRAHLLIKVDYCCTLTEQKLFHSPGLASIQENCDDVLFCRGVLHSELTR